MGGEVDATQKSFLCLQGIDLGGMAQSLPVTVVLHTIGLWDALAYSGLDRTRNRMGQ